MQSPKIDQEAARYLNQGQTLLQHGHVAAATVQYSRALALLPDDVDCQADLALALIMAKRLEDAEAVLSRAIRSAPNVARLHRHLAHVYKHSGRLELALQSAARALKLSPHPQLKVEYADLLLSVGRYEEAWRYHDSRLDTNHARLKALPMPIWRGESLEGRSIFVYQEEAFGDAIQMLRYVPMLREQAGAVFLHVANALVRLARNSFPGIVVADTAAPIPKADLHCPMLSLPGRFGTTLANIPQPPYLASDAGRSQSRNTQRLNVGLVWAAGPKNSSRSMTLGTMLTICEAVTTAAFFGMQVGASAAEIADCGAEDILTNLSPRMADFADTAATIEDMDLIVTIDTSVAHLAGAMGRRCFVLLPFVPDSRWMRDRSDSPWYPSIRLFRQKRPGDWSEPLREVREALAALL